MLLTFEQFENRHYDGWRVEFEHVLVDEPGVGHHRADFKPPDLLPANPPKQVDLFEPRVQNIHGQIWFIRGHD